MKQISLKIGLFLLTFFSFLSVSAYDFEVDGLYYTITSLKGLTVSVDGCVNKDTTNIVIPQTIEYKGKKLIVTSVGAWAFSKFEKLQSVSFPSNLLSIGEGAFFYDKLLTNVVLPDSLSSMGGSAFECCALKSIRIPEKITSLARYVFCDCKNLVTITLHDKIESIGSFAFAGTSIKTIELPTSVTDIGEYAFRRTCIQQIKLPVGIKSIPAHCFAECKFLKNIQWTDSLESIWEYAFSECDSLESFTIPSNVTTISPSIIYDCENLSKLTIGKGLKGLPFNAFYDRYGHVWKIQSLVTERDDNGNGNNHLKNLKTVIIEDADDVFSMKGFPSTSDYNYGSAEVCIPAFANLLLDYFYVGRPLVDIKSWKYRNNRPDGFSSMCVSSFEDCSLHIKKLEIAGSCTTNPYFYQTVDTLILGTNINTFYVDSLHLDSLKTIVCKSTIPPVALSRFPLPNKIYIDVPLYVPMGCKEVYRKDPVWGNFWTIKEYERNDDETGISNAIIFQKDIIISTDKGSIRTNNAPRNSLIQVYNLQGMLVAKSYESIISGLAKGSYIVTVGGKTFKVAL